MEVPISMGSSWIGDLVAAVRPIQQTNPCDEGAVFLGPHRLAHYRPNGTIIQTTEQAA
jgi:hypothetical protein